MEGKIKVMSPEEQKEWLKDEIKKKGLYNAVKDQLDELMYDCRVLNYIKYAHVVECSFNILDLIETFGEKFGIHKDEVKYPEEP